MAYLTAAEARSRLSDSGTGYGFTVDEVAGISPGDVMAASADLDAMGPFKGIPADVLQESAFPRLLPPLYTAPQGGSPALTPDAVLDWVALRAYQLSVDDEAPVSSEGAGRVSVSYARPKTGRTERLMASLLEPYLLRVGRLV